MSRSGLQRRRWALALGMGAVVCQAPTLLVAYHEAFGVRLDATLAWWLVQVRAWGTATLFTGALAFLAHLVLELQSPIRRAIVAALGLLVAAAHILMVAPALAASLVGDTFKDALSWEWIVEHPGPVLWSAVSAAAIDTMAVALIVATSEEPHAVPLSSVEADEAIVQAELARLKGAQPPSGSVEAPAEGHPQAASEPPQVFVAECEHCGRSFEAETQARANARMYGHRRACPERPTT